MPGLYHACTTHAPRMYLACTSHVPGFHLPIPSQAHGSYLPCTWLVSGFRRLCPVIPQSAIRNPHSPHGGFGRLCPAIHHSAFFLPHSPPCVLHKPPEYNSPPAPPSGWSGGTLDLPWTCPIPIEPSQTPVFDQPSLSRLPSCGISAAGRFS